MWCWAFFSANSIMIIVICDYHGFFFQPSPNNGNPTQIVNADTHITHKKIKKPIAMMIMIMSMCNVYIFSDKLHSKHRDTVASQQSPNKKKSGTHPSFNFYVTKWIYIYSFVCIETYGIHWFYVQYHMSLHVIDVCVWYDSDAPLHTSTTVIIAIISCIQYYSILECALVEYFRLNKPEKHRNLSILWTSRW